MPTILRAALGAEPPFAFAAIPGQRPKTVVPRHYTLRLQHAFMKLRELPAIDTWVRQRVKLPA
jgi:hypothetical protein